MAFDLRYAAFIRGDDYSRVIGLLYIPAFLSPKR